jgi:anhydro-N-acetylmuramic acid kinase
MSGTSLDAVDYALCAMGGARCVLRELWTMPFPDGLRRRLHAAASGGASGWETAQLHHDLGRFYARGARRLAGRTRGRRPAVVGLHGQTIFHRPGGAAPATLQLGEPAYLAEALGVPVVSNFRAADLAAGGQGAPLATLFHVETFGERGRHVCVNNLGGISNVTSIDWRRGPRPRVLAFDTGPACVLPDLAMRRLTRGRQAMDRDGAWAARGRVHAGLLGEWLRHPFFRRMPPKSTGRELFGETFLEPALRAMRRARLRPWDMVATLTALSAASLADNYRRHLPGPPDTVVLTGGGAANPELAGMIEELLRHLHPWTSVETSEERGWPLAAIEPAAFALLAWRRWHGRPGNLPETTGARRAVLCGQLTEPGRGG